MQTTIIGGNLIKLGVDNTSAMQFSASQSIFNRDVLIANRTKGDVRKQASQQTTDTRIEVIAGNFAAGVLVAGIFIGDFGGLGDGIGQIAALPVLDDVVLLLVGLAAGCQQTGHRRQQQRLDTGLKSSK